MHSTAQRNCFTKKNRLPDAAAYKRVFSQGTSGVNGPIRWFVTGNDAEVARLGTAVPKRHVKTAVLRNRIKRIIRESFRHNQKTLAGLDVVVVVQKPVNNEHVVRDSIRQIWRKVAENQK